MGQEEEEKQYRLRLPASLYDKLVELSRRDNRSVNGQILTYLQEAIASEAVQEEARSRKGRPRGGLRSDDGSPRTPALALAGAT